MGATIRRRRGRLNQTKLNRLDRTQLGQIVSEKALNYHLLASKVIIEKSRGEVSLMGQDTIENVS